jgi:SAM-dependent methyltransferase
VGLRSFYEDRVLPHMIKCACGDPKIMELRSQVIPLAEGRVFELGVGGGLNQQFYDPLRVTRFGGIDPGERLLAFARDAARAKGWDADIRTGRGEAIPFADESFDTVVSTYTLCSVDDPARVLRELRRILRPGGKILFLEHGASPDAGPAKWQRRIEPVWKRAMGNCHLTRPVSGAVKDAGFAVETMGQHYMPKMPRWAGWMEWGAGWKETG